jgi:hypothetical protein
MTDEISQRIITKLQELGEKFARMAENDQQLALKLKSMLISEGREAEYLELTKKSEWALRMSNRFHQRASAMIAEFDRSA